MIGPADIRALILDMDGVLWRGKEFLPGVPAIFTAASRRDLAVAIATNNATVSAASVVERLATAGVRFPAERVMTSAHAAAGYLVSRLPAPVRVYVIGETPLQTALADAGCELTSSADHASAVVVGMDRRLDWAKLVEATLAIRAGAVFLGTNPDPTFPFERGLGPGNGAILAALEKATGAAPIIVGKPEAQLFLESARRLGVEPRAALVVGDRIETDIVGGRRAGMPTALLLSGVSNRAHLAGAVAAPDLVFDGLPELADWLDSRI